MFGFDEGFERREIGLPEGAVVAQPGVHGFERGWIQLVDAMAAFAVLVDEARAAKKAKMFGDSRARDGEGTGDGSGGKITAAEEIEDSAAGGVGKGAEGGFAICNRTVTHHA